MRRTLALALALLAPLAAHAQHAPYEGVSVPAGLQAALQADPDFIQHGDPGWTARVRDRRDARREGARLAAAPARFALPVLLGGYSDQPGSVPRDAFDAMLFGDDYPTGSMRSYYDEISYGQFDVSGDVHGWYRAPQTQAYYTNDSNGYGGAFPGNAKGFVVAVVASADADVDFSRYDNDGPDGVPNSGDDDGFVDAVAVVYAGAGADWGGSNTNIWPHQSSLGANAYVTNDAAAGGGTVRVSTYFVAPERYGSGDGDPSRVRPMGVYAHEFGHILGLPDLYDRTGAGDPPDFDDSNGIGEWGLMAQGSWGGDGQHPETPDHMTAWAKMELGWLTPRWITRSERGVALQALAEHADAVALWEDGYQGTRYFLIENRQPVGFDRYLNGAGLMVYHVDENARWGTACYSCGAVNNDERRKLVDVEEADGAADLDNAQNRGDAGDAFPGSSGVVAFTGTSVPSSDDHDGAPTGVSVTGISASGPVMTFDVEARSRLGAMVAYDENGVTGWGWGFAEPMDIWGGVEFEVGAAGQLAGVDLGLRAAEVSYELLVYPALPLEGSTEPPLVRLSGTTGPSGWHTVTIPEADRPTLSPGQNVFVAVRVIEQPYGVSYDRYGAKSGRSYTSTDGVVWSDAISTSDGGGDVNLRIRVAQAVNVATNDGPGVEVATLLPAFPNPAADRVTVAFETPTAADVTVTVYDALGRTVATLADGPVAAGRHDLGWNAAGLAGGVYVVELASGTTRQTQQIAVGVGR